MYDFNKREDFDYSHSYDYLGGVGLGRSQVEAETLRQSNLGKYDLLPVDPPESGSAEIIKIATLFSKSNEREKLLDKISSIRDRKLEFVWNVEHANHLYFLWALHCIDRQVPNWTAIRKNTPQKVQETVQLRDYVAISGIGARPELNEKVGQVVELLPNDRFLVEFSDIYQSVSISSRNCRKCSSTHQSNASSLPRGLRVEIRNLNSESGKLLNGRTAYILTHDNGETERYAVRVDGETKSIKTENLHIPAPPGWDERLDEATGKLFYVHQTSAETTWVHPVFIPKPSDTNEEFDRQAFLRNESKRLKLDRREKFRGMKEGEIAAQLAAIRQKWGITQEPLFSGTPRELVNRILESSETKKTELLIIAFSMVLEDFKALKFNKSQLMALCAKIDELEEEGTMTKDIEAWLMAALQIAIPTSYIIK